MKDIYRQGFSYTCFPEN